jgi:hypothetical protein
MILEGVAPRRRVTDQSSGGGTPPSRHPIAIQEFPMNILLETPLAITDLANLGTAGLMGAMWLWERRTSRQRDQQLDESHTRILSDRIQLDQLITLVRQNTEALTRMSTTQEQFLQRLAGEKP